MSNEIKRDRVCIAAKGATIEKWEDICMHFVVPSVAFQYIVHMMSEFLEDGKFCQHLKDGIMVMTLMDKMTEEFEKGKQK